MRRLLAIATLLILTPAVSMGAETQPEKVMVFPFKVISKAGKVRYSKELAAVLGGDLAREGELELVSGGPFVSVIRTRKVNPRRLARIARRMGLLGVIWGDLTQLESGYSLEVSVMGPDQRKKPYFFSTTGKNMEELVSGMRDLAGQIGKVVLKRPVIGKIKVEGNKRIQREAILNKLEMKEGSPFRRSSLGEEIRDIYSMGYFEDVQIKAKETPKGKVDLTIMLKERPSIKEIDIEGNKVFSTDEILDSLTTKSFSVVSLEKIRQDIAKIRGMYEKKGYYQPKIDYEIKQISPNEAKLVFKINEGKKSWLTKIVFEGRKKLSESELKKIMSIQEKSWVWFLDESGQMTREQLDQNRLRLIAHYLNKGFMQVQVGAPRVKIEDGSVTVTYPINEGPRFQVRKVNVAGDLIMPREKMIAALQTKPRTWFSRKKVVEDIQALTKLYNNAGYAYADIEPLEKGNEQYDFVDLTYKINKGRRVSIERVDIRGNERTRGKVIRRSLAIGEGDLYNIAKIEASKRALEAMDFFEAVKIKTSPGSRPDLMDLEVEVLEKKTGSLAAGIGYSSQDGAMGNIDLKERNLFGLGIVANIKGNLSARRNSYEGSLTYPWLFDYPLSGTINGYRHETKEQHYFRESDGFGLNFGYRVYGPWSLSAGIARDSSKLSGFEKVFARSVTDYYAKYGTRAEKFLNISDNSASLSITRDTRIGSTIPIGGSKFSIGSRISGFGGDVEFSRYYAQGVLYQKLFWKAIMKVQGNGSALVETGGSPIPFDRRILLGGIASIRGYQYGQIGPRDRFGNIIGGDRALFANIECLFPVLQQMNLNGVVFIDAGNAWNVENGPFPTEVKAGAGVGVRWLSPMGPIRIEYGWKINPEKGEAPGAFAFAMGQLF
ncbi:MAG: outer membrane protein assembly factor BamA [Deltaproteobacteria bacterium]